MAFKVTATHPDYAKYLVWWKRCSDVYAGEDAVKAAGMEYLPKLSEQSTDDYNAYKTRASFYGVLQRTIESFIGIIFKRLPEIEHSRESVKEDITDTFNKSGQPLFMQAKEAVKRIFIKGRVGVLLDLPEESSGASVTPQLSLYSAESIRNWKVSKDAEGNEILVFVVLAEMTDKDDGDEYDTEQEPQLRVLYIDKGRYSIDLYRLTSEALKKYKQQDGQIKGNIYSDEKEWALHETVVFQVRGRTIDYVPFVICGVSEVTAQPVTPPLLDMVNLNLSHYRTSADLEHGRHFTALPTAVFCGFDTDKKICIGSQVAYVTEESQAHAEFLEYKGEGLGALERGLQDKEDKMAAIGSRILEEEKRGVESVHTARLRKSNEHGMLGNVAISTSAAFSKALSWWLDWRNPAYEKDINYDISTDYSELLVDADMLEIAMKAVIRGQLSEQSLFANFQKAGLIERSKTFEDEKDEIQKGTLNFLKLTEGDDDAEADID